MVGAAVYGAVGAVWMFLLGTVAPQPAGSVVLWGSLTLYGAWGTVVFWRRTALPFVTLAVLLASLTAALLAALAFRGWPFPNVPDGWMAPIVALLILGPILLVVESRLHPLQWTRWKAFAEDKSAWDILLMRHVPYLEETVETDPATPPAAP